MVSYILFHLLYEGMKNSQIKGKKLHGVAENLLKMKCLLERVSPPRTPWRHGRQISASKGNPPYGMPQVALIWQDFSLVLSFRLKRKDKNIRILLAYALCPFWLEPKGPKVQDQLLTFKERDKSSLLFSLDGKETKDQDQLKTVKKTSGHPLHR